MLLSNTYFAMAIKSGEDKIIFIEQYCAKLTLWTKITESAKGGIPNCTIIAFEWGYYNSFVIDGWGAGNLKFRAQCAQWGECWKVKQKEYLHDKLFINKRKLFNTSDSITRTFILSAKKMPASFFIWKILQGVEKNEWH